MAGQDEAGRARSSRWAGRADAQHKTEACSTRVKSRIRAGVLGGEKAVQETTPKSGISWAGQCPQVRRHIQPPLPPAASTAGGLPGGATGSSTASMACAAPEQTGRSLATTEAELLAPTKRTWLLWLDRAAALGLTRTVRLRRLPCKGEGKQGVVCHADGATNGMRLLAAAGGRPFCRAAALLLQNLSQPGAATPPT